jgi:DNA polymerase III delta subunit
MIQSKKFSFEQLKKSMYECLKTEGKLKSTSINEKIEMEFLIATLY